MPRPRRPSLPVFLVGCHRSGTTLTRYLLDAHPRLACPPESKFLAGLEKFIDYPQAIEGLFSLGFDWDDIYAEVRRLIEAFLGGYARRHGKARWIDKTPNYYRLLPFIDEVFRGRVLYLFIVRHPLDCIASLEQMFWGATAHHEDPDIARVVELFGKGRYAWAQYWNQVYERLAAFAGSHPRRSHVFRYEDLAQHPEATMRAVLAFLGESLPPGLLRRALRRRPTPGFQDHKIRRTHSIETASVGKWRAWPAGEAEALWALVAPAATRLGYQPPS